MFWNVITLWYDQRYENKLSVLINKHLQPEDEIDDVLDRAFRDKEFFKIMKDRDDMRNYALGVYTIFFACVFTILFFK